MFEFIVQCSTNMKTPDMFVFEHRSFDYDIALPPSFVQFSKQFGAAKLFKKRGYYKLGIIVPPTEYLNWSGVKALKFGFYDDLSAYFKFKDLRYGQEPVVYEGKTSLLPTGLNFEAWIEKRFNDARKAYTKTEWQKLVDGPSPFNNHELEIVESRKLFEWQVVSVNEHCVLTIHVANKSSRKLPYLSLGVRSKNGTFLGGIKLTVGHIEPGSSALVLKECYKGHLKPGEIEVYALPSPEPYNKERYWEFRKA